MLDDGARFPARSFTQPAEFDRFFGTFDRRTRANLTQVIDRGGPALQAIRRSLPAALQRTPPAWAQVAAAFREIGGDDVALDTLLRSTDAVVDSIHRADPGLAQLVADASSTFDSLASESGALRGTLSQTPGTLVAARRILAQADGTLSRASRFAGDAAPGVAKLRDVTQPLAATLGAVERVSPDASRTLRTLRSAAPSLDALLGRARSLMPGVESIGRQGTTQLDCIRPYTPEIAGFFGTWGPRAWGNNDGKDTYLRGQLGTLGFPDTLPFDSKTFTTLFPQVKMSFPRPPGDLAGQPWYQPQCGITDSAYDPTADPESARNLKAPSDPARSRP
jgi:ABC-type transporter Mla subunit MlaD